MKLRTAGAILSAGVLAVALGVGTPNASALDASADNSAAQDAPGAPMSPDMQVALQRDLHLTTDQAIARLAKEAAASRVEQELLGELGTGSGGAWLTEDDQRLIVTITDPSLAALVRARGAEPRLVTRSAARLDALLTRLGRVSWIMGRVDPALPVAR